MYENSRFLKNRFTFCGVNTNFGQQWAPPAYYHLTPIVSKGKYCLFYAMLSFVHHFKAICEFKLELQSGNAYQGCQPFPVEIQNTSRWDTDFGLIIQNKNLLPVLHNIQILVVKYRTHPTKDTLRNKYFFFNKETNAYNW